MEALRVTVSSVLSGWDLSELLRSVVVVLKVKLFD